jgi:hypothetical protein
MEKNILFVPVDSNYPGYDLFYYHGWLRRIYFIQISIYSDPMLHVNSNDVEFRKNGEIKKAVKSWIDDFLPDDVEIVELWMIQNSEAFQKNTSERKYTLNVVYLDEIDNLDILKQISQKVFARSDIVFDEKYEK